MRSGGCMGGQAGCVRPGSAALDNISEPAQAIEHAPAWLASK
jgi:hypothetical protein